MPNVVDLHQRRNLPSNYDFNAGEISLLVAERDALVSPPVKRIVAIIAVALFVATCGPALAQGSAPPADMPQEKFDALVNAITKSVLEKLKAEQEKQKVNQEKLKAEQSKQMAEQEKQRTDQEKQQAEQNHRSTAQAKRHDRF